MKHRAFLLGLAVLLLGCARPLPDAHSPAAQLYAARCGGCHQPYDPRSLTADMWRVQLDVMRPKMAQAGIPLSDSDAVAILSYLQRNSEKP